MDSLTTTLVPLRLRAIDINSALTLALRLALRARAVAQVERGHPPRVYAVATARPKGSVLVTIPAGTLGERRPSHLGWAFKSTPGPWHPLDWAIRPKRRAEITGRMARGVAAVVGC